MQYQVAMIESVLISIETLKQPYRLESLIVHVKYSVTGKQANKHDLISFLKDRDLISVKKSSSITKLICFYDVHYEGSTDLFWQPSRSQW